MRLNAVDLTEIIERCRGSLLDLCHPPEDEEQGCEEESYLSRCLAEVNKPLDNLSVLYLDLPEEWYDQLAGILRLTPNITRLDVTQMGKTSEQGRRSGRTDVTKPLQPLKLDRLRKVCLRFRDALPAMGEIHDAAPHLEIAELSTSTAMSPSSAQLAAFWKSESPRVIGFFAEKGSINDVVLRVWRNAKPGEFFPEAVILSLIVDVGDPLRFLQVGELISAGPRMLRSTRWLMHSRSHP